MRDEGENTGIAPTMSEYSSPRDSSDDSEKQETNSSAIGDVVPKPVEATTTNTEYQLPADASIAYDDADVGPVAEYLADLLRPATGFDLPIAATADVTGSIRLQLSDAPAAVGKEGYELSVTDDGVSIHANEAAGLFAGVQSLRQLFPSAIESDSVESGPWTIPGGRILDYPRFEYRGAHLDVARHFFGVDDLKRFIDYIALYKFNHVHLHLTDDQGWRIEIESWPKLTNIGAETEVGGGDGGYYTREEYEEIVAYAGERFITVVPEIDVPGHTNAALSSYDELNCDGEAAAPYTGTEVGFSALCVDKDVTYEFLDDVISEVAALTPGPFVHIGGDEAHELTEEEYAQFIERAVPLVEEHGKRPVGWHQILAADPPTPAVGQYWSPDTEAQDADVPAAVDDGHELVLSPASHTYLDLKYDADTERGLDWAGHTTIEDAYDWDPGDYVVDVDESSILGIEAALWTETLETLDDVEFMLFPRLPAIAERGWTPTAETNLDGFKRRLAGHGPRWDRLGVEFFTSPDVPWPDTPE